MNFILRGILYLFIAIGLIILTAFSVKAFDYYIMQTLHTEEMRVNNEKMVLLCLSKQTFTLKVQAEQIHNLTAEKQETLERCIDMEVENTDLREAVKHSSGVINYLLLQLKMYKKQNKY